MAKTKADLAKRVLQKLKIVAGVEEPQAHDAQLVKDVWDTVRLELLAKGVAIVDGEAIPLDVFEGVSEYVAAKVAVDFGIALADGAESAALGRIFASGGMAYNGTPVTGCYF